MARQVWLQRQKMAIRALALTSVIALTTAQPALAGFEWTPPPARSPQQQAPMPASGAVEAESLGGMPAIEPFPLREDNLEPIGAPVLPSASMPPVTAAPVMPVFPSAPGGFAPAPPPPAAKNFFETVDGFGSDIPLALAMQQIVPPGYSYAFDPDINPGTRLNWNGGKPWNEVLEDAVRPGDMRIEISGNTVRVRQTWASAEDMMQTAAVTAKPGSMAFPSLPPVSAIMQPVPVAPVAMPPMAAPSFGEDIMPPQSYPRRARPGMPESAMPSMGAGSDIEWTPQNMAAAPPAPMSPVMPGMPIPRPPEGGMYAPVPLTPSMPSPPAATGAVPMPLTPPSMASAPVLAPPGTVSSPMGTVSRVLDPHEIGYWQAEQGASLKDTLGRWSSAAGVALLWNSAYDYVMPMPVRLHATFPEALTQILSSYNTADPRPVGQLHPNLPQGPSVLVVENFSSATN